MDEKARKLILVVDDTQMNVEILLALLGKEYDIAVATSGEAALEITKNQQPDLILLDVVMPKMNGFEVCKRIKQDRKLSDIPIVFLSALDEEKDRQTGLLLGAIDFIDKPFNIDDIHSTVHQILTE